NLTRAAAEFAEDVELQRNGPDRTARGFFQFFFSGRRRHTRSYGDWSSDVCSSDLSAAMARWARIHDVPLLEATAGSDSELANEQIGRASCREREEVVGVFGSAHEQKQIADRAAADPCFSAAGQTQALTIADSGGNL